MSRPTRRLAVVGGGISGLAAAREIARLADSAGDALELTLLEGASRIGGSVRVEEIADSPVDMGAESMLARGPDDWLLLEELGLGAELIRPATNQASVWTGRRLVPLPGRSSLGVPLHPWSGDVIRAAGLLGALRAGVEPTLGRAHPDRDGPIGPFVSSRLGPAVWRRLVEPLLGGVYAGPGAGLSLGAVAPQLLAAAERSGSLLRGLRSAPSPPPGPVPGFVAPRGGLGRLLEVLERSLPDRSIRLGTRVRELHRGAEGGVRLELEGDSNMEADGVVLAVPAAAAAVLLSGSAPQLAGELRRLEYASVATVALAYPDTGLGRPLFGSGFLVPRTPGRVLTACTYLDRKWPHLKRPGLTLLRASAGSLGEEWILELDDATLVSSIHQRLRRVLGLGRLPQAARVERWRAALPQYRAGHLAWAAEVSDLAARAPFPIALAGSAYQGVGLVACLRGGAAAGGQAWRSAVSPAISGGGDVTPN